MWVIALLFVVVLAAKTQFIRNAFASVAITVVKAAYAAAAVIVVAFFKAAWIALKILVPQRNKKSAPAKAAKH